MARGAIVDLARTAANVRTDDVYVDGEIVGERVASELERRSYVIGCWPEGQARRSFDTGSSDCLSLVADPQEPVLVIYDLDSPRFFVFSVPRPAPRVKGAQIRTAFRAGYQPGADDDEDGDDDW